MVQQEWQSAKMKKNEKQFSVLLRQRKTKEVYIMIFIIFTTIIIAAFIIHKFHYNTDTIVVVVVIALAIMGFSCNRQFDSLFKKEIQKKKRII